MSYATIVSEQGEGRYTIELDWGAAMRDALIAAIDLALATVANSLEQNQANLEVAEAKEQAAREAIAALIDQIAAAGEGFGGVAVKAYAVKSKEYALLVEKHRPLRQMITRQKLIQSEFVRRRAHWVAFDATDTRQAWCTTFTEGATGVVGTIEVNGEPNLILIAPNARAPQPEDGITTPSDFMTPEQAFFNAAILPGWQKWMPTYRWGTLTAVNVDANTASVSLANAVSSAQNLGINQQNALANVPVEYMDCNAEVFEVGDNVIVKFEGQDQSAPKVIGFLDNPKECKLWPWVRVLMRTYFDAAASPTTSTDKFGELFTPCNSEISFFGSTRNQNPESRDVWIAFESAEFYDPYVGHPIDFDDFDMSVTYNGDFAIGTETSFNVANMIPAAGESTARSFVFLNSGGYTIRKVELEWMNDTWNDYGQVGEMFCVPISNKTGWVPNGAQVDEHMTDAISRLTVTTTLYTGQPETWLTNQPTITVESDGRTREYNFDYSGAHPSVSGWRYFYFKRGAYIN